MAVHKIFRGDRTRCARLYPLARQKLGILRRVLLSSGQTSATQRFDLTTGEIVMIYVNGSEEYIYITAGGDGYYCLGDLGGDEDHISASPTARGAFAPRGVFKDNQLATPNLFYVGRGKGVVPVQEDTQVSGIYETRNGKSFNRVLGFGYVGWGIGIDWMLVRSARAGDVRTYGIARTVVDNGDIYASYIYTLDGADTWQSRITGYGSGYEVGVPHVGRTGPESLFMFVPAYKGGDADNTDPQLSYVQMSHDNGQSWSATTSGDLLSDITDAGTSDDAEFNGELAGMSSALRAASLHNDSRDILLLTRSPILGNTSNETRVYRADRDTGETVFVMQIADGFDGFTSGASNSELRVVQDVPFFSIAPPDWSSNRILVVGNTDGTSWAQRTMPWPSYATGLPTTFNERIIVCPAYNPENGHYELYQTEDLGQSWQFRATIRTDAPPPDEDTATLLRFGVLSILRQRGRPANSFPGQPWVGDDRITPPGA